MDKLSRARCFLLDMDGTFYLGDELLAGAQLFLDVCAQRGVGTLFLTNNSSKSADDYVQKLGRLGVVVQPHDVLTSGDATLGYLRDSGAGSRLLLTGTPSLERAFADAGYDVCAKEPEAVVLGFDTGITYEKLTRLCDAVRAGLPYIATHPDLVCPVPGGEIPDIGAVIAFVQEATGRLPDVVVGKPGPLMAEAAAKRTGLPVEALCMVGDRLYTDMAMGACGVGTALVLSGETKQADLACSTITPDFVFENLLEMAHALQSESPCP